MAFLSEAGELSNEKGGHRERGGPEFRQEIRGTTCMIGDWGLLPIQNRVKHSGMKDVYCRVSREIRID